MDDSPNQPVQVYQYLSGHTRLVDTHVISEKSVGLCVNGEHWLTLMCTPLDLDALAVGFLFNEGLLEDKTEIIDLHVCQGKDNVDVWLSHELTKPEYWHKTTGCSGGLSSLDHSHHESISADEERKEPELPSADNQNSHQMHQISPETITGLMTMLYEGQSLYQTSGGVHTSILSDASEILYVMEDIGRHNTLDKISGRCLLDGKFPPASLLLTTGRISSEMLQKANRMKARVVVSRTSPTNLSIKLADNYGITLIGYARKNQFSIYTHPHRIFD